MEFEIDYWGLISSAITETELGQVWEDKSGIRRIRFFRPQKCSVCGGWVSRGWCYIIGTFDRNLKTLRVEVVHKRCINKHPDPDGFIAAHWGLYQLKLDFYVMR